MQITSQLGVELRYAEVCLCKHHFGVGCQRAHEVPLGKHLAKCVAVEFFGRFREPCANPEPAGQHAT